MNIVAHIWKDQLHDNVIWDYILKIWITGLMGMFVLGFSLLMYGIISGEADIENATFGVFDTLGY
jgi:hypothetical protein|tara:strand:- start:435 stop:629 length:195 start_codon:yes stop_codon:yes gene_type:complete